MTQEPILLNGFNDIYIAEEKRRLKGISVTFYLISQVCTGEKEKGSKEIDERTVIGFRNICCGLKEMNNFSMIMNIQKPMTINNYDDLIASIHNAYIEEIGTSMKEAVREIKSLTGTTNFNSN